MSDNNTSSVSALMIIALSMSVYMISKYLYSSRISRVHTGIRIKSRSALADRCTNQFSNKNRTYFVSFVLSSHRLNVLVAHHRPAVGSIEVPEEKLVVILDIMAEWWNTELSLMYCCYDGEYTCRIWSVKILYTNPNSIGWVWQYDDRRKRTAENGRRYF